jgi:TPR repeat protein
MNNLGLLYLRGQGVPRDYAQARKLFEQGIALGDAANMNELGIMYVEGDGVPKNLKIARQWYEKAAALGLPQARQNLKGMPR